MKEQVSEKCGLLPSELKEDMLFRVFRELSIVKDNTRLLVLVTNGFMELLINRLIETKTKNAKKIKSNGQSFSYATKLLILNEINVISNESYEVFEWFRKLRNNSAHSPVFEVTKRICRMNSITIQATSIIYVRLSSGASGTTMWMCLVQFLLQEWWGTEKNNITNKRLKRDCQRAAFPVPLSCGGFGCCV
ncbi:hypothetical protein RZ186_003485 [Vibrio cholerae]|nr:hypothetical protein [Vibrio cholerae]ELA3033068.1 hypothetical protein [Vibrio cholerae]ELN7718253.1 hypothetical protein [Vibrio cholerae]